MNNAHAPPSSKWFYLLTFVFSIALLGFLTLLLLRFYGMDPYPSAHHVQQP